MNLLRFVLFTYASLVSCSTWMPLEEWLLHPDMYLLGSGALQKFIPLPKEDTVFLAYDRFSILDTIERILYNAHAQPSVPFERQRTLSEDVLAQASDDYRLGMVYLWSLGGVPRDFARAQHHFELSAGEGNEYAMFMLGVMHATGSFFSEEPNPAKAVMYYSLASTIPEAQLALGHRYKYGLNVPIDHDLSLNYYQELGSFLLSMFKNNETETLSYPSLIHLTSSFGGRENSGLYGRHVYRKRIPPQYELTVLPVGDQNTLLKHIRSFYGDEFDSLEDAFDTLTYRAIEEEDPKAMLSMAMYFKLTVDQNGSTRWEKSIGYARKCIEQALYHSSSTVSPGTFAAHVACGEFMAERYLIGDGRPRNITRARELYHWAFNRSELMPEYDICPSCVAGLALCDWMEHKAAGRTIPLKKAVVELERAFFNSISKNDASLGVLLSDLQISLGNYSSAHRTLIKTVTDTNHMEPVSLLMLGELEFYHVGSKGSESIRDRYESGLRASQEMLTPIGFAQVAYEQGDLESAIIAYAICSELGVREADINLADLMDVRHSMLGVQLESWWPRLKSLSTWALPSFVKVDRREVAVQYFGRAALHHSVDALAKLVEYGWQYGLVPATYVDHYLRLLMSHNFGMAHWWDGTLLYKERRYSEAMLSFSKAMVSPEAWLPVKFSQFLTALHLLRGDEYNHKNSSTITQKISGWSKALEAYRSIIADEHNDADKEVPATGGHRIWACMYVIVALILAICSVLYTLARHHR